MRRAGSPEMTAEGLRRPAHFRLAWPGPEPPDSSASDSYQVANYSISHNQWTSQSQSDGLSSPVYHMPYPENPRRSPPMLAPYSKPYRINSDLPNYIVPVHDQESNSSTREYGGGTAGIATRSPVPSEIRAPGGCGGHCPGFEYVCYYVLQIIFVVGILTGISLCIAGSVLRRSNRGGDLGVLVYIGCLAFMVCSLLLGVQCCVRRSTKQRCKQLRLRSAPPDCIPLDTIPNVHLGDNINIGSNASQNMTATRQLQPLIFPSGSMVTSTLPRNYYRPEERHRMHSNCIDEVNGIPWWRRQ